MNKQFRRNTCVTGVFFLVRFVVALGISLLYILVAAAIQYYFVALLGESTFNYIVGGLLSLFLGALFCHYVGALIFMFVKGWHVAALAYVPKIVKTGAPAFNVGLRAFSKNLMSFGAVYGVRVLLKNTVSGFKDKLWDIADDIPFVELLRRFAEHPIVEYIASDVLHYGFDAAVYYLVRYPPEDINEVPNTVLTAIKKYLYCIPSILLSSVQTYIFFRFIPKVLKWILILWVFLTQGLVAGILITVLMFPVFYILDNAFFDPLTMVMFISAYAKQCDKEVNEEDPVVQAVNSIIDGANIGTTGDDFDDVEEEPEEEPKPKPKKREPPKPVEPEMPPEPSDEELFGAPPEVERTPGLTGSALGALAGLASQGAAAEPRRVTQDLLEDLPLEEEDTEEDAPSDMPDFFGGGGATGLADLFRSVNGGDLDADPLAGLYSEDQEDQTQDRAQSLLLGDEE